MNQLKDWVKALEQVKNWSEPQKIALAVAGVVIVAGGVHWIEGAEYRELEREIEATTEKIRQISEDSN